MDALKRLNMMRGLLKGMMSEEMQLAFESLDTTRSTTDSTQPQNDTGAQSLPIKE